MSRQKLAHLPELGSKHGLGGTNCWHANGYEHHAMTSSRTLVASAAAFIVTAWVGTATLGRCGSGNEATAIGSLRAINSGQASYAAACAGGGYATDLSDLVRAPSGSSQGFISPDLSTNGTVKSGYVITLSRESSAAVATVGSPGKTCNGSASQPVSSYFAAANPVSQATGTRYFATDTRGTIFFSTIGPIPNPIPANAPVVQ